MADMIYSGSVPATLPVMNLFSMPDTQTAVRGTHMVNVYPVAPPTMSSVTEFHVSGVGKDYTDTGRILLHMTVRYVRSRRNKNARRRRAAAAQESDNKRQRRGTDDSDKEEDHPAGSVSPGGQNNPPATTPPPVIEDRESPTDLIFPINALHHTAWRQIDVVANGINLIKANNLHPYETMMKLHLRYGIDAKRTHLQGLGYYNEEGGMLDDISLAGRGSVIKRVQLYSDGKTVDLEGPLLVDALQLNGRPLINGVNLVIKLYPCDKAFYTMTNMDPDEYDLELVDIYLKVCKVQVADSIILGHSVALEKTNAIYPFTRCDTKSFTYGEGLSNICVDDMFNQRVPSRLVFGMVSADAFNGNVTKNPFNFKHNDIADIALTVDGLNVPGKPLKLGGWPGENGDPGDEGRSYVDAYLNLFHVAGTMGQNGGNNITIEQFAGGFTLFAFNLDPEMKSGNHINLTRRGNVRLEIRLKQALTETTVLFAYGEHFEVFEITGARSVIMKQG